MPGIGNNLYPPIVPTWMPAFVRTTTCNIYFSLSMYNNEKDIKNVQVIVNNQTDNRSALDSSKYPTGIKICDLLVDNDRTDDKYYIKIEPSDLTSKAFGLNLFYKVQIRFTGVAASAPPASGQIAGWLVDNQQYFSEWSTVCLIKGIEKPSIYLKGFEQGSEEISFAQEIIDIIGQMYYEQNQDLEKEALKHYNILLYNVDKNEELVYDSGNVYTNVYNPNEINHTLKVHLENGVKYRLLLLYTTTNEYTDSVSYVFTMMQNQIEALSATVEATPNIEYGCIRVDVKSVNQEVFFGNLTIRRTSSESNFTVWEDVHQVPLAENKPLNCSWNDYTVESGVWYKYGAQRRNGRGDRSVLIIIKNPVMIDLDDMFLTRANLQFRVRFDPSITSFKYTYSETKVDTLGSQYPRFRRNGIVKYRQFPIGGLITSWCDDEGVFLNKDNIYKESKDDYEEYNKEEGISEYRDYIYERRFREKIMDFLYADDIKLFRSPTEGNILIRLMDISLTPNQTLGRMLYSFSANAYEIDDCNIDNYSKYGIQDVGDYSDHLVYTYDKIGQVAGTYVGEDQDLITMLRQKYEQSASKEYKNTVQKIKWLRIEFISDPYLIEDPDGNPQKIELTAEHPFNEDIAEGYIVYLNKQPIVVSPWRYIEFNDDDTDINSVYFPYETEVTFDYTAEIEQSENTEMLYSKIHFSTKAGQLHDVYQPQDNLFNKIYAKYLFDYSTYHQELISLDKLVVEADPGTVIYVKDSFDPTYFRHEIGGTGVLEFYDDEAVVSGFYLSGLHLIRTSKIMTDDIMLRDNLYYETGIKVADVAEIKKPMEHGVYECGGRRLIYHRGQFYEFTAANEVQCPLELTVDYIYETMKGEY